MILNVRGLITMNPKLKPNDFEPIPLNPLDGYNKVIDKIKSTIKPGIEVQILPDMFGSKLLLSWNYQGYVQPRTFHIITRDTRIKDLVLFINGANNQFEKEQQNYVRY